MEQVQKKRTAILGGTFDPPHYGHLMIANEVLDHFKLDHVYFMPNRIPPHKEKTSKTTNENRVDMLRLAIEDQSSFSIEEIELERAGVSFTYDTIRVLRDQNPENEYYFIIGADMVEYLPNWHKIDDLLKIVTFIGVNRPNYELKTNYPITTIQVPQIDLSSSLIRERCKRNKTIKYLVPEKVRTYIKENCLYGC